PLLPDRHLNHDMPLSVLLWLPAVAALVAALLPRRLAGRVTLVGALGALALAIGYVVWFDRGRDGRQFVTHRLWSPQLGIHYKLGLDGLNLFLVLLTALLFAAGMLAANLREWD